MVSYSVKSPCCRIGTRLNGCSARWVAEPISGSRSRNVYGTWLWVSTSRAIWTKVLRGNPSTTTSGMAGNSWAYEFAGRRGRNRAAGKASFLHPGLVFLRPHLRSSGEREKHQKPNLRRVADDGRRKVGFDIVQSHASKAHRRATPIMLAPRDRAAAGIPGVARRCQRGHREPPRRHGQTFLQDGHDWETMPIALRASSHHDLCLAAFITNILESDFSVHTPPRAGN